MATMPPCDRALELEFRLESLLEQKALIQYSSGSATWEGERNWQGEAERLQSNGERIEQTRTDIDRAQRECAQANRKTSTN